MLALTQLSGFNARQLGGNINVSGAGAADIVFGLAGVGSRIRSGTGTSSIALGTTGTATLAGIKQGDGTATITLGLEGAGVIFARPTGLVSLWSFDQFLSGQFADQFGGHPMVDESANLSVNTTGGLINQSAVVEVPEDGSEINHWTLIAEGGYELLEEGSVVLWVRGPSGVDTGSVQLRLVLRPNVFPTIGDQLVSFSWPGYPQETWIMFVLRWNSTNKSEYSVNGGASWQDFAGGISTGFPGKMFGTLELTWGGGFPPAHTAASIRVDELSLWDRALDNSEVDWLYNSGAGRGLPFTF